MSITIKNARKRLRPADRRIELRNSIWPESPKVVWDRASSDGWTSVPRLIPHVCAMIDLLSKKGNPSRVYIDLWLRAFDDGFVQVESEDELAFSSGLISNRARRTWQERIEMLQDLEFVKVAPRGNTKIGFILLVNPIVRALELYNTRKFPSRDVWFRSFLDRGLKVGALSHDFVKQIAESSSVARSAK